MSSFSLLTAPKQPNFWLWGTRRLDGTVLIVAADQGSPLPPNHELRRISWALARFGRAVEAPWGASAWAWAWAWASNEERFVGSGF